MKRVLLPRKLTLIQLVPRFDHAAVLSQQRPRLQALHAEGAMRLLHQSPLWQRSAAFCMVIQTAGDLQPSMGRRRSLNRHTFAARTPHSVRRMPSGASNSACCRAAGCAGSVISNTCMRACAFWVHVYSLSCGRIYLRVHTAVTKLDHVKIQLTNRA